MFCAVDNVAGASPVEYLPSSWKGVALWFGVTAFLFCVHSMVSGQMYGGRDEGRDGGRREGRREGRGI